MPRQHLEALLHRRVDVRRHAAARVHPHLDPDRLPPSDGLEAEALLQDRILDDTLLHVCLLI